MYSYTPVPVHSNISVPLHACPLVPVVPLYPLYPLYPCTPAPVYTHVTVNLCTWIPVHICSAVRMFSTPLRSVITCHHPFMPYSAAYKRCTAYLKSIDAHDLPQMG